MKRSFKKLLTFMMIVTMVMTTLVMVNPVSAADVSVNDNTTGTSNNQFEYVGSWQYGSQSGAYNNDNHWSNSANAYYQIRFTGTQVKVYAAKNNSHGIAAISIDGGAETNVDTYASTRSDNVLIYTSPILSAGQHTLKVRVTGTKNSSANNTYIIADRVDITPATVTEISINDTTTGTANNQFEYSGTWDYGPQPGAYSNDNHWSSEPSGYYQVKFYGTQAKVYASKTSGNGIAAISIDGGSESYVDTYSYTRYDNALIYTSPTLSPGQHTLKVRVTGSKNSSSSGTYIIADRIDITPSTITTVQVNDNSVGTGINQFEYGGPWSYGGQSGAYNNDNHWSNTSYAYYLVRFGGTQVKLYAVKGPGAGIAAISIDGGSEINVDLYASSTTYNTLVYTSPVLNAGQHTLKVRVTGKQNASASDRYITADRVEVLGTSGAGVVAATANDFLNSLGVCTHMAQGIDDATQVANALSYTGIRAFRDDFTTDSNNINKFISVHNSTGARISFLVDRYGDINGMMNSARTLSNAGALLAIEGANEPNNWSVTYQGQTTDKNSDFTPLANYQRDIYSAIKADSTLRNYPVFHSSEAGGSEPNNVGLQFNTIPSGSGTSMPAGTVYADYANVHNYICRAGFMDNMAWINASSSSADWMDGMYKEYGLTWFRWFQGYTQAQLDTLPKVATETGWHSNADGINGALTYEQQGRLYMTMYLSQFKQGFAHTFMYMLKDDPSQDVGHNWGLYNSNWTAKTVANYLHNFTTILADTGSFVPETLNYSVSNQPTYVHDLLLQKSDGKFMLAIWAEKVSGATNVTVNLGSTFGTVKIYNPRTGTSAIQTLNNVNSVSLTMDGYDVRIIEI